MENFLLTVKALIIMENGNILVTKRAFSDVHKPGDWEIPGGRLMQGESPFAGLQRQVSEETGLAIDVLAPLAVEHFERDDGQINTMITFLCRPRSLDVRLSDEHVAHQWCETHFAKELLSAAFDEAIDTYTRFYKEKRRLFR